MKEGLMHALLAPALALFRFWKSANALVLALLLACQGLAPVNAQEAPDKEQMHEKMAAHAAAGETRLEAKDYQGARDEFNSAFETARSLTKAYSSSVNHATYYREQAFVYLDRLSTVFSQAGDKGNALKMIELAAPGFAEVAEAKKTTMSKRNAAAAYGRLAYQRLLAGKTKEAAEAAQKGLEYDADQVWIKTNLAHSLLISGQTEEAMKIYTAERKTVLEQADGRTFEQMVLDDFKELEGAGIQSPGFHAVRQMYGATAIPVAKPAAPATPATTVTATEFAVPAPAQSAPASASAAPEGPTEPKAKKSSRKAGGLFWLFFFGLLGIIALVFGGAFYFDRRRTQKLESLVKLWGWRFRPFSNQADVAMISASQLGTRGRNRKMSNFIELPAGADQPMVFDAQFTEGSGKSSRTYHQTVVTFKSDRTRLIPVFVLRPESLGDKIGGLFGGKDFDFPTHPKFSGKYLLRGPLEPAVREFFTDAVLAFFEEEKGWTIESVDGRLFIYRERQRPKPEEMQTFIEKRRSIYTLLTEKGGKSSSEKARDAASEPRVPPPL